MSLAISVCASVYLSEKNGCYALGDKLSHKIMEKGGDKEKDWRKEDERECSWAWTKHYYTRNKKLISSSWIAYSVLTRHNATKQEAFHVSILTRFDNDTTLCQLLLYFCCAKFQFSSCGNAPRELFLKYNYYLHECERQKSQADISKHIWQKLNLHKIASDIYILIK